MKQEEVLTEVINHSELISKFGKKKTDEILRNLSIEVKGTVFEDLVWISYKPGHYATFWLYYQEKRINGLVKHYLFTGTDY